MEHVKRYEVLGSLPAYGPMPVAIAPQNRSFFSEGFVVRFYRADGTSWVANFLAGDTSLYEVIALSETKLIVVIAGGTGYLMNPEDEKLVESVGWGYKSMLETSTGRIVLSDDTSLLIIELDGTYFNSPRISWDGIAELIVSGAIVSGLAFDPRHDADVWSPFSYNLDTRVLVGGSWSRD